MRLVLGRFVGRMMILISHKRKRITYDNLRNAFPKKSHEELMQILNQSYHNLGITLMELLTLKTMTEEDLRRVIKYKNIELIEECVSRGKGVILLSGHYGNWEFLAYSAGLYSCVPTTVIIKRQKNKFADKILNEYRTRGGNRIIPMRKAAIKIVKTLKKGEAVALLVDQAATKDSDLFVEFFGRPAATYDAPAILSLKFGTPIIIGFADRQLDGTYEVELREIKSSDLQPTPEGIEELTKRHVKALEEHIRQMPGLWAWQHKRWKHKPKEPTDG